MKPYSARSVSERRHSSLMADALARIEHDVLRVVIEADGVPDLWHDIAGEAPGGAVRDRVTMRVDRDVIRFFKSMGRGYQERMSDVLRAWMHGRLAKVIDGPDTTDIVLRPDHVAEQAAKTTEQVAYDLEAARQEAERKERQAKMRMELELGMAKLGLEPQSWRDD